MDHFDFEGVNSCCSSPSSHSHVSRNTACSSLSSPGQPRAKASRVKHQSQSQSQSQQTDDEESWRSGQHNITTKTVRFSLSPASTVTSRQRRKRRIRSDMAQNDNNDDDDNNNQSDQKLTSPTTQRIRGAGTDVFAVQDAGSFRMLHDEAAYLCSTILSSVNPTHTTWQLALMMSHRNQRRRLWSLEEADTTGSIEGILHVLSTIATKKDRNQPQTTPSTLEALAVMAHFISWDCTTSSPHSASLSAGAARKVRSAIFNHTGALLGLASLLWDDPIVHRYFLTEEVVVTQANAVAVNSQTIQNEMDDDLSTSQASSDSVKSGPGDPTTIGRRQRKRRRIVTSMTTQRSSASELEPIPEHEIQIQSNQMDDTMSFTSDLSSIPNNQRSESEQYLLHEVRSKIIRGRHRRETDHTCGVQEVQSNGMLALEAMLRIIQGKEGDEESCMDHTEDDDNNEVFSISTKSNNETEDDVLKREEASNPLLVTNSSLRQSGALPHFSQCMAETLTAIIISIKADDSCSACIAHLHRRLTLLALLIDGACCLSELNRQELCIHGGLIGSILQFLDLVSDQLTNNSPLNINERNTSSVYEIALISIRTLTSLSHENSVADEQLMTEYALSSYQENQLGAKVIAELLFRVVESRVTQHLPIKDFSNQLAYDVTIFCLNTLTNAIQAQGMLKLLADHIVAKNSVSEEGFVSWLTHWVVSQTESFRDGVMHGSFGKATKSDETNCQHSKVYLDKHADENLILSGNGFILLVCCMIQSDPANPKIEVISKSIRAIVIGSMPRDDNGRSTGFTLIKNTLKAFCNYYYYSVRDLSVAVVAPVKKLLVQLENLET